MLDSLLMEVAIDDSTLEVIFARNMEASVQLEEIMNSTIKAAFKARTLEHTNIFERKWTYTSRWRECIARGRNCKAQPPQPLNTTPQEDVAEAKDEGKAAIMDPKGALASVINGCNQEVASE